MNSTAAPYNFPVYNISFGNPTDAHRIKKITATKVGNSFTKQIINLQENKNGNRKSKFFSN